jgi:zinc protease
MLTDRTIPPTFKAIPSIEFSWPQKLTIQQDMPLFLLEEHQLPIISLTLLWEGGSWYELQPGVAHFTAKMLLEGTRYRNAQQVAAFLDHYGARLSVRMRADYARLKLMCLTKHFTSLLELITECLLEPSFSTDRLEHLKHLKIQSLMVENEKNHVLAQRFFKESLLGNDHPYGHSLQIADVKAVHPPQVGSYYQQGLFNQCTALLSGNVTAIELQATQDHLAKLPYQPTKRPSHPIRPKAAIKRHIPKPGSLQSAICIGKVLFPKNHPAYLPMYIVIMLLGGYFGSRLMRNIRERKGYTYHIYATLTPLKELSYFLIGTEVIQEYAQQTCQAIYQEIETLQNNAVEPDELATLRNYLLGSFLASINNPFSKMERFKEVYLHGLDQSYYRQLYETLHQITPTQIKEMASTYLSLDSLTEIIVG